ncbi:MAG: site-specific DNA-methyltransferase [Deltaproteobacteria bacterium]|jgi:site-specific DNA-methyltransferase (cytosine-N4-specific)|nr:site-specific DNA-methyltransferase [Deltaproteobacteria bacterium]
MRKETSSHGPPVLKEKALYATGLGAAYVGDSRLLLRELPAASVNLAITSPPFALHFKKEYGNKDQPEYIPWFLEFAREVKRVLAEDGSFVVDLGGAYEPGRPTRSLYHFKLLISLVEDLGFYLAQELYWYNPGKMPAPAEWVTVRRLRVKDSVNCLWWLSKTPNPKADNRKVLVPYSRDMERLIQKGYRARQRPSGHNITEKWGRDRGGAICSNLIVQGNNDSNGPYLKLCEQAGFKPHPARFPPQLPEFFVNFLTDEGDLVLDLFAGSNTTGAVCERLRRRWLAFELESRYLEAGRLRFPKLAPELGLAHSTDSAQDGQFSFPLRRK